METWLIIVIIFLILYLITYAIVIIMTVQTTGKISGVMFDQNSHRQHLMNLPTHS